MNLTEITTKLEAISLNPCACNVCKHAAKLARDALMEVSPLGEQLLLIPERNSDEFRDLEKRFRDEELARLTSALFYLKRGRCMMRTPEKVPVPPDDPAPQIPELPYQQGMIDALERYRKWTAPRRVEYKKNPRIPGTYVIK